MKGERRGIDDTLRDVQCAIRKGRIRFGRQRHAFLHDVRIVERGADRFLPGLRGDVPAEHDALAAVFVVGLQDQLLAVRLDPGKQVDLLAARDGPAFLDDPRPGNVRVDHFPLCRREEVRVPFIAECGQAGLLVQQFAAERVDHADGAVTHRLDDGVVEATAFDEFGDEHTFVNEIDRRVFGDQAAAGVFDLARVHDDAIESL
jgi:hypothetical protein